MRRLALALATCGGVGYAPVAPGTFGSAAGVVLFYAVRSTGSAAVEIGTIVVLLAIGVWSAGAAERHFGAVDPGPVVIDEVAGMLITLAFIPVNAAGAVAGFFVFRALDIVKPWPAARLEAWPGGRGVMADDVMAALYGNVLMRAAVAILPGWLS
jgi:phosphatidylglycerophosphatase A